MIDIFLYNFSDDVRKIDKTLTNEYQTNAILKDATSTQNPVINIQTTDNLSQYNYLYIPNFGRYYFIDDIISVRNNLWQIQCSVDVLMTYSEEIKQCKCLEARNSDQNSKMVIDPDTILTNRKITEVIKFNTGEQLGNFTGDMEYVLVVAGGGE